MPHQVLKVFLFNRKLPWVDLLTLNNALSNVKASTYHNNMFGFDRSLGFAKLYNYLGVGQVDSSKTLSNLRISAFPFLCLSENL